MTRFPLTLLLVAAASMAGRCFGQSAQPCFAFLLRADVMVACEGKTTQITHRGDVETFAISTHQSRFVYSTSRITKRAAAAEVRDYTTTLIDLKARSSKQIDGERSVMSTCGGLFSIEGTGRTHSGTRDLITGDEVAVQPYNWFRCSADQKTVIGTTNKTGDDLREGIPPQMKIAAPEDFNVYRFNISPDGVKTAFYNDGRPLCIFSSPGPAQCVKVDGTMADLPSVNDAGEVLVAVGTAQECFYRTPYNFSPTRLPGATDESRDQCLGIGYWKSGLRSIKVVEVLGRNPQWIDPPTAALLRDGSAHLSEGTRK